MAAQTKACVLHRFLAGVAGSNPVGSMDVSLEIVVLSLRGLCVGLVTHPEGSYRVCVCVIECECGGLYPLGLSCLG